MAMAINLFLQGRLGCRSLKVPSRDTSSKDHGRSCEDTGPRGREGAPAGFHGPFERICLRGVGQGDLAPTGPPFAAPSFFCQGRAAGPRFHFPNAENLVTFAPFALGPFPASSRALRDAGDELDRGSRRIRCNAQRSWNWEQESGLVSVASKARANAFAPLRRAG